MGGIWDQLMVGWADKTSAYAATAYQHVRIRSAGVGLKARYQSGQKNMVVSALQPERVASGPGHEVEIERKIERSVQARGAWAWRGARAGNRRPVRSALDQSETGADVPAIPIVGFGNAGHRWCLNGKIG